jgi:hypothetical protein
LRAALAISLHALGPDEKGGAFPRVFPLDFKSYPLAFILVLSDELQEYLRWEGASVKKHLKFDYHPVLRVEFDEETRSIRMNVAYSFDAEDREAIIERATEIARFQNMAETVDGIDKAVDLLCNAIKEQLERKLALGGDVQLTLSLWEDWSVRRYSKDLSSV